ncbi:hypothetical protein COOONC_16643 [Cooperia oncophora]
MVLYSIYDGRPNVLGESLISLLPPEGENIELNKAYCVDLKNWTIDRHTFVASYIARMVGAPFLMSSLSLHSNDSGKQVLEIGLGGGTFDMGLHALKPYVNITAVDIDDVVMNVATKWFGVVDSKYHHSLIQDGVEFVENAIKEGRKFDVVAIDACDNYPHMPCPAEPFRSGKFLEKLREVMTDKGTLIVNLLTTPGLSKSEWNEVSTL